MPGENGFWLAQKIKDLGIDLAIVFTTAYDEFAVQAIRHAAFDFLLKPIVVDELRNAIRQYCKYRNKYDLNKKIDDLKSYLQSDKIRFNTVDGFVMVALTQIIYCKAEGNYTNLFLSNGSEVLVTKQLGSIEDMLPEIKFIRINRSYIINMDYLNSYNRKQRKVILYDILQKYEFEVSSSGHKKLMTI